MLPFMLKHEVVESVAAVIHFVPDLGPAIIEGYQGAGNGLH